MRKFKLLIIIFSILFIYTFSGNVLASLISIEDDFSNPRTGWEESSTELFEKGYLNGKYMMMAFIKSKVFWSFGKSPKFYKQYSIETLMELKEGKGRYGFIFNYKGRQDYYVLQINPAFHCFRIARFLDGNWTTITEWTHELEKINSKVNKVKLIQIDNEVSIHVNDYLLHELNVVYNGEEVKTGILICTMSDESFLPFMVNFDNYRVTGVVKNPGTQD